MKIIILKTEQEDIFKVSFGEPKPRDYEYLFSIKEPSINKETVTVEELLNISFNFKKGILEKLLIILYTKDGSQTLVANINITESIISDLERDGIVGIDILE